MNETTITISGNLVDTPEVRFTPAGTAVATFRVASTPRYQDSHGQWKDGDTLFLTCVAWRQLAENIGESLEKGTRVMVTGRLTQRSYETAEGERRTVYELQADEAGASLRTATATITKATRTHGGTPAPEAAAAAGDSGQPPF